MKKSARIAFQTGASGLTCPQARPKKTNMSERYFSLWAQALIGVLIISGLFFGATGCDSTRSVGTSPATKPAPPPGDTPPTNPPNRPPGEISVIPYTRVICHPNVQGPTSHLETILTQAGPQGFPTLLSLKDESGQPIHHIDRLEMISGNENSFSFVFSKLSKDLSQVELFLGKMDLLHKSAQIEKLATAPLFVKASGRIDEPHGIAGFTAFSRMNESLLVPDLKTDSYVIRDSFSPQVLSYIFLSPKEYINPVLSADADTALFQKLENGNLRSYAYSLETGETIPFPVSSETVSQFLPHIFRTGHIAWLEKTNTKLFLKLSSWDRLTRKSAISLAEISEQNLGALDFGARQGHLYLAKSTELFKTEGLDRRLLKGSIEITEWNLTNIAEMKKTVVEYPKAFFERALTGSDPMVENIMYSPWNNQWVVTTSRGVSVFNNKEKSWSSVGPQNGYLRCLKPNIGPEYHVEEVHE